MNPTQQLIEEVRNLRRDVRGLSVLLPYREIKPLLKLLIKSEEYLVEFLWIERDRDLIVTASVQRTFCRVYLADARLLLTRLRRLAAARALERQKVVILIQEVG